MCLPSANRGRGYYKMNTLLLSETGVDVYVGTRLAHLNSLASNLAANWEVFKKDVKTFFLKLGKAKAKHEIWRENPSNTE